LDRQEVINVVPGRKSLESGDWRPLLWTMLTHAHGRRPGAEFGGTEIFFADQAFE